MKFIKWLWEKAERNAYERIVAELYWDGYHHRRQAELYYYRDKAEPGWRDKRDTLMSLEPELSPDQHGAIADEMYRLHRRLVEQYIERE